MRRPSARRRRAVARASLAGRTYRQLTRIVRVLCTIASPACLCIGEAVYWAVGVTVIPALIRRSGTRRARVCFREHLYISPARPVSALSPYPSFPRIVAIKSCISFNRVLYKGSIAETRVIAAQASDTTTAHPVKSEESCRPA